MTSSFLKPNSRITSVLRCCMFPTIFLICVNFLVPPDFESWYTARFFEPVRSTRYVSWRVFGAGGSEAAFGDRGRGLGEVAFCKGMAGGGEGACVVLVVVSVERHRALGKGKGREMGVESSRPVVDATGRRDIGRIMMCWGDASSRLERRREIEPVVAVFYQTIPC